MPIWYDAGMKLAQYLDTKGISQTEFASRIGVTQVAVSRYVSGDRTPSLRLILRIEKVTKGAVKPKDWAECEAKESA